MEGEKMDMGKNAISRMGKKWVRKIYIHKRWGFIRRRFQTVTCLLCIYGSARVPFPVQHIKGYLRSLNRKNGGAG